LSEQKQIDDTGEREKPTSTSPKKRKLSERSDDVVEKDEPSPM